MIGVSHLLIIIPSSLCYFSFFFFNDTATTEIYTLSLHDALPVSRSGWRRSSCSQANEQASSMHASGARSEEHTSELQSHVNLVCRLLLEKKKKQAVKDYYRRRDR